MFSISKKKHVSKEYDVEFIRATIHFTDGAIADCSFVGYVENGVVVTATELLETFLLSFATEPGTFIISSNLTYYPNSTNQIKKVQIMNKSDHILKA